MEPDIYLLLGQSNMSGRGQMHDNDRQPHDRVLMLSEDYNWVVARDPVHYDKPDRCGKGPALSFAMTLLEAGSAPRIGLVPGAVGGSGLASWARGRDLYESAMQMAEIASVSGRIRGILWHQGESDAHNDDDARSYAQRLTTLIADWRHDLDAPDLPVVVGELGHFLGEPAGSYANWRVVNEQLHQVAAGDPRVRCVSAAGLDHIGDHLHFNREAAIELGIRYGQAMLELTRN